MDDSVFITSNSVPFPHPGVTECFEWTRTLLPTSNMLTPNLTQLSLLLSSASVVRGSIHTPAGVFT